MAKPTVLIQNNTVYVIKKGIVIDISEIKVNKNDKPYFEKRIVRKDNMSPTHKALGLYDSDDASLEKTVPPYIKWRHCYYK